MADSSTKSTWWKSLTLRKKNKDVGLHQDGGTDGQTATPDKSSPSTQAISSTTSQENKNPNFINETEFADPRYERGFNEKTCRRNLKISRSGRFKEKRRLRASLPDSNSKFFEDNGANPNEET
ncbi:proline-rich protein 15 [Latimeria chalumnae]|uniref:Proline rich 15 n=1 Tax=Latimeria chalumnae TaxID=7897 RepID=H3BBS9_LATCH|nr:PREDICTED: proline-rich protein 15 [Latimeria chalumnae]|eukprot:XP_014342900.1 PREDICTED: proline-rich protein 15 [Latimeria chalumnae]